MEDFIVTIKSEKGDKARCAYNYLVNNYMNMSKDDLKSIAIELIYQFTQFEPSLENAIDILESIYL